MSAQLPPDNSSIKIQLAPMEGVVDWVIRDIYSAMGGYDHFVTEFVRVSAHVLPKRVFYKYCPELLTGGHTAAGDPVFVQLLGGDPELMAANAVQAKELGAKGLDINFGCPAKRVNNHDGGAALLKSPDRIFKIVSAIRAAVGDWPVTAKVRLGFDHCNDSLEIAKAVEDGGAEQITVHARTKMQGYKPPAHWHFLYDIQDQLKIPVIANGDIWSAQDYEKCKKISGCHNIALGRTAIANPGLARQIKGELDAVTWSEVKSNWLPRFIRQSLEFRNESYALQRAKQWTKLLGREFPESTELFQSFKQMKTFEQARPIFEENLGVKI